jgi:hypothetical protein
MSRRPLTAFLTVLALTPSLFSAPVPAGGKSKDVTDLPVPANAMAAIQLNGLDRSKARVLKLLEPIDAEIAKQVAGWMDEQLKEVLEGRDLKGIDANGRVFVAVAALGDLGNADPPVSVSIPVADYKTFREKFLTTAERKSFIAGKGGVDEIEFEPSGKPLYLVDNKAGYVIASPNKELAESYADKFEPLSAKKLGTVADSFLAADVAVFLNVVRVNEVYGEQIKQGKAFFNLAFQQGGGMGLDPKQMQAAKVMFDGLFQVIEDANGFVVALDARPEGGNLRLDLSFLPSTPSANVLANEKPTPLKVLNDQPKGMNNYSASKWGKAFADLQRTLGGEFAAPDGDDKLADAIEKWTELFTSTDGETVTLAGPAMSSLTSTAFKDPTKVADAKLKLMKKMTGGASYSNVILKQNPEVKEASQKHAGFTLHSASIEVDYQAAVRNLADDTAKEAAIEAMKKLLPEKQTIWFGSDATRYIQITAKDWDTAKAMLDGFAAPKAKVGDDPAFLLTRKQLPEEAGFLSLVDTGGMLGTIGDYLSSMGGAIPAPGVEMPRFGKVSGDPAYIGVAFTARPQSARFDLFVPTGAMKAIKKSVEEGQKEKEKDK